MGSLYGLFPHQEKGLNQLRQSFQQGKTRPMFMACTGFGKTVVMAHVVASSLDKGKKILVIAPYTALINQTAKSFMDQGIPQPGIIQADHPWTDSSKRLQIASIQTLIRRKIPEVDLILVDEAHIAYESFLNYIKTVRTPVIGFTATPFTKGLGLHYNNLIEPISMKELIDTNYLSEYIAFAPCSPDMEGVKTSKGDYEINETGERMSKPKITGSITETWLKKGNDEPTVCFAVNIAHANHIGSAFDRINITNEVITAKTPIEEREIIFDRFAKREVKILINVGTLVAGFDADVRCIIYARPTKSEIRWIQCIGRGLRTADGKEKMILLDHSGTIEKLGFPEDITISELCNGENVKAKSERKKKEMGEKLPKACPKCSTIKEAGVHKCPLCEFEPRKTQDVEVKEGELKQIKGKMKTEDKKQIYAELLGFKIEQQWKGKHISSGWIAHTYKDMTGVWPRNMSNNTAEPSESTLGFIKHKQIAWAKRRNATNQR